MNQQKVSQRFKLKATVFLAAYFVVVGLVITHTFF